jgi:hypothetical protein
MLPLAAIPDAGMRVLDESIPDPEAKSKAQQESPKMQAEGRFSGLQADVTEPEKLMPLT